MATRNVRKSNFTSGELSPTLKVREDIQQYADGCAKLRNMLIYPQGGVKRRPGLEFQEEIKRKRFKTFTLSESNTGSVGITGATPDLHTWQIDIDSSGFYPEIYDATESAGATASDFLVARFRAPYIAVEPLIPGVDYTYSGSTITIPASGDADNPAVIGTDLITIVSDIEADEFEETIPVGDLSNRVSLKQFRFSNQDEYLFVLANYCLAVYYADGTGWARKAIKAMPWAGNTINEMVMVQDLDTAIFIHSATRTQTFARGSTHEDWTRSNYAFVNIPWVEFQDSASPTGVAQDQVTELLLLNFGNYAKFDSGGFYSIFVNDEETEGAEWKGLNNDEGLYVIDGPGNGYPKGSPSTWRTSVAHTFEVGDSVSFTFVFHNQAQKNDILNLSGTVTAVSSSPHHSPHIIDEFELNVDSSLFTDWSIGPLDYARVANGIDDSNLEIAIANLDGVDGLAGTDVIVTINREGGVGGNTATITFTGENSGKRFIVEAGVSDFSQAVKNRDSHGVIYVTERTKGYGEREAAWSERRGWPGCGTFHGGRLWLAGSYSQPQTIWSSRVDAYTDFNSNETLPDFGVNFTIRSETVSPIYALNPGRHLQVFTGEGEYYVPSSSDEVITPENFNLRRSTRRGIKRGTDVHDQNGFTYFLDQYSQAIYGSVFDDSPRAYTNVLVTSLASHLLVNPTELIYRRFSEANECDYLYVVNGDGTLAVLNTLEQESVNGFSLLSTAGSFLSGAVVGEDSLFAIRRNINSVEKVFLERFNSLLYVDSGVHLTSVQIAIDPTVAPTAATSCEVATTEEHGLVTGDVVNFSDCVGVPELDGLSSSITYLTDYTFSCDDIDSTHFTLAIGTGNVWQVSTTLASHLVGETMDVLNYGNVQPQVTAGAVTTIDANRLVFSQFGLPFPDVSDDNSGWHCFVELLPLAPNPEDSARGLESSIGDLVAHLFQSSELNFKLDNQEGFPFNFRSYDNTLLDSFVPVFTGNLEKKGMRGFSESPVLTLYQTNPLPLSLLGITYKAHTQS